MAVNLYADSDGRYKGTWALSNPHATKYDARVKSSDPQYYSIIPETGFLDHNDGYKVQIILREYRADYDKHQLTVDFHVSQPNKPPFSTTPSSVTRAIQLISKNATSNNSSGATTRKINSLNRSVIDLETRYSIQTGDYLLVTEHDLFPNPYIIPKAIRLTFNRQYQEYLIETLKRNFKNILLTLIKEANEEKIKTFRIERDQLTLQSLFWKPFLQRKQITQLNNLLCLLTLSDMPIDKFDQMIIASAKKYFDMCMTLFYDEAAETKMRQLFVEWFKSGQMTKAVYDAIRSLRTKNISPKMLKDINWKVFARDDHYSKSLERILQDIDSDKFLQKQDLQQILNIFAFEEATFKINKDSHSTGILQLNGRIIFLSDWISKIEQEFENDKTITEVRFYAKNVFNIDSNLENSRWHGKNLVIAADKIHVWAAHMIDVSGVGYVFSTSKTRARDGKDFGENGADGKDGDPGESSGNIVILTEELINENLLTLKLNGGDGQHGQDGGHGANGKNGEGVTDADFKALLLSYSTLYWGGSSHFFNFTPSNTKELSRQVDTHNKYVNARFQDDKGRIMYWSYAEDYSFWSFSTYDLYFLIKGTQGTTGGIGGKNGVGGEGGNRGECVFRKLYSGKEIQINNLHKNPGRSGEHGCLGKAGYFGKNGNDMAFVDRSTMKSGKKYIGLSGNMSISFNYRMNNNDSRIDGYEKWVQKRSAHYVHFNLQAIAEGAIMTMSTELRANADRQSQSKTTSKASIIVNNVIAEFTTCFQKDEAIIIELSRVQEQANQEENEEDEQKNEETVAEEINVLLDSVDQDNNSSNLYGSQRSHLTWSNFVRRLKSYKSEMTDASIDLGLELFRYETDKNELEQVDSILTQLVHDVKAVAKNSDRITSKYNLGQIQTLADSIEHRLKQKKMNAVLRAQNESMFENYLNIDVKPDLGIDSSTSTLIGVLPEGEYQSDRTSFFNQYQKLGVTSTILDAMFDAFNYLHTKHGKLLAKFDAGKKFNWNDDNAVRIELERHKNIFTQQAKTKESYIDHLENVLKGDMKNVDDVFEKFNNLIKADTSKVLLKRFGLMPTSKIVKEEEQEEKQSEITAANTSDGQSKGWLSSLKDHLPSVFNSKHAKANFVIKFYFQTRSILTFNRMLYFCNIFSNSQILHPGTGKNKIETTIDIDSPDFTNFMTERKTKPIDVESGHCEEFVNKYGINCAVGRLLFAYDNNTNVRVYEKKHYALVELKENFNSSAPNKLLLLSENKKMYTIRADSNYRSLIIARKQWVDNNQVSLPNPVKEQDLQSMVHHFPKEYIQTITTWIRTFQVISQSRGLILLSLLKQRFETDGCQLSIVELQAILNAYSYSVIVCRTNEDFLLKVAAISTQHQILGVFLYLRIENALKRRINKRQGKEIINSIHSIDSPHLKALFATKLNNVQFDETTLLKVLIMLRYAVDRFQRLEKMTLDQWIDTSQRQKWSAIGELLKDYGSVGYYLAFLDSRNRSEEPMLRKCLQEMANTRILIPEKVIARIAYLIVYGEVNANQHYFQQLKNLLEIISKNYSNYLPLEQQNDTGVTLTGYPLLMNERNQNEILTQVKSRHSSSYEPIFPTGQRTVEKLRSLIVGQHDNEQTKTDRQVFINRLAEQLNAKQCQTAIIINEVDDVIAKIFSKPNNPVRLRDTQKMAVMIAAESQKNTLLQVNTGEGKTMLIATLAIIRARQNKTVDVITSSPVLAARDVEKMQPIFKAFRITASHNCEEQMDARKLAYKNRIVYGDMQHFQRDFLLHNFYKKNILGDRQRQCVIVDEVDNMLLDNGNNMLYLSHNIAGLEMLMSLFVFLHRAVHTPLHGEQQYTQFDSKAIRKEVIADLFGCIDKEELEKLSPNMRSGIDRIWEKLIEINVIDRDGLMRVQSEDELPNNFLSILETLVSKSFAIQVKDLICVIVHRERQIKVPRYLQFFILRHLNEFIENTKRALFMKDRDEYVIDVDHKNSTSDLNPRVTIIDKNTGVDLVTSQWSEGLHQAIQLKHGCRLSPISLKAIFVSNVGYFKGYERINGLSGTLGSIEESKSLVALYEADLVRIPTWKPKNFYEHVPLVAANQGIWLQNIYDEVKDQIVARRSVLIICNSINQVDTVHRGLEKLHRLERCDNLVPGKGKFAQLVRKHFLQGRSLRKVLIRRLMVDCFDNLIVYRRDHDQFDLSGSNALANGRIIIATNLAGRGTDIELSEELQKAGGLHVIVTFLPDNCRIEEQAFGRAARCGHPGSGQIIALIDDDKRIDASETPTIFQLKEFRDNAEVHRLQSLKRRYDFCTAVEESCLNKFWEHSSKALESVKTSETPTDSNTLPTSMQIVYFALLDEWALWLDEKADLIEKCSRDCSDEDKESIIKSVEEFLRSHPLDSVNSAMKWVRAPQPLLTIGLIALNNKNTDEAKVIFNRVVKDFPEFQAEAMYYLGVIQQRVTRRVHKFDRKNVFTIETWENFALGTVERDLVDTFNIFHESRRHFSMRRHHRSELVKTVSQLQQVNQSLISTNGFVDQHKEYVANYDAIVGNIDKFLGKVIQPDDLRIEGRDEAEMYSRATMLKDVGLLTRTVLTATIHQDQIEFICNRHPISRRELEEKLESLRNSDSNSFTNHGRPELETHELRRLFKLPSRLEFWQELRDLGVFVEESKYFTSKSSTSFSGLTPVDPKVFESQEPLLLQFTDVPLNSVKYYKLNMVLAEETMSNHLELESLLESGTIATEIMAVINPQRLMELDVYMRHFEGFKLEELQDHLGIDEITARWIISLYVEDKVLNADIDQVYRLVGRQYTNDLLPTSLCRAVESFFADRFAYTHALEALRESLLEAARKKGTSKYLYLPCNPYEDLLTDMIECGIAIPSRVSLTVPRKIDNNYDNIVSVLDDLDDNEKIKDILEANRPNMADADCKLVATQKYVINNGTDLNDELKHFISNGIKQVAIVEDDTTWVWLWGVASILAVVVAVAAIALLGWTGIGIAIGLAAIALAARAIYKVGSYIYYRVMRTSAKRTVTVDKQSNFEFTVLREFNGIAIQEALSQKEMNTLVNTVHHRIIDLSNVLERSLMVCIESSINFDEHLSQGVKKLADLIIERTEHNANLYDTFVKLITNSVKRSINDEFINDEVRLKIELYLAQIEPNLYTTLKSILSEKPMQRNPQKFNLLMDDFKKNVGQVKSDVLTKLIKNTCKQLPINLMEQLTQLQNEIETNLKSLPPVSNEDQSISSSSSSKTDSPGSTEKYFKDPIREFLVKHCSKIISNNVSQTFREPLLRRFESYVRNATINNISESTISNDARNADIDAKRQHRTFEKLVQAKTQIEFLETETKQICAEYWNIQQEPEVLKCMIANRYPLPISTAPTIEKGLQRMFSRSRTKLGSINFVLVNKHQQILYGQKKEQSNDLLQLVLTTHEDHFYSARNDSLNVEDIELSSALYESLCQSSEHFAFIFHSANEFIQELPKYLVD